MIFPASFRLMRFFGGIAMVLLIALSAQLHAQRTIHLATESGFDPFGFSSKLSSALQKSSIGGRFKAVANAELERINATKVGDLAVQVVSTEMQCSGAKTVVVTLIFMELGRDKTNSVQKIYLGSSMGSLSERSIDTDVDQFRDVIVNALASR